MRLEIFLSVADITSDLLPLEIWAPNPRLSYIGNAGGHLLE